MLPIKDSIPVAEVISKPSPVETLRNIQQGDKRLVLHRDIDASVVRSTVSKLNYKGYKYKSTSHIEGTVVERFK